MKEIWEEVQIKTPECSYRTPVGECPKCGGRLYHEQIPCPDSKSGCLVIHYGNVCENCRKIFQKKLVLEEQQNEH